MYHMEANKVVRVVTETVRNGALFAAAGAGIAWGLAFLKAAIPAAVLGVMIPGAQIGLIAAGVLGAINMVGALASSATA